MVIGTYTAMTQMASVTGIPVHRIHPELGGSHTPPAPVSGGSITTASVLPAVKQAAENALKNLVRAALAGERSPLRGREEDTVMPANGCVFLKGAAPESGVAPAIANAIYHAMGKRLRELPITPDKLL
jgi:xanthine dehydrogenase YagR molybdenum-binding subunit